MESRPITQDELAELDTFFGVTHTGWQEFKTKYITNSGDRSQISALALEYSAPLHWICDDMREESDVEVEAVKSVISILVAGGLNINASRYDGVTPLMDLLLFKKVCSNMVDIAEHLFELGADPSAMSEHGGAFFWAFSIGLIPAGDSYIDEENYFKLVHLFLAASKKQGKAAVNVASPITERGILEVVGFTMAKETDPDFPLQAFAELAGLQMNFQKSLTSSLDTETQNKIYAYLKDNHMTITTLGLCLLGQSPMKHGRTTIGVEKKLELFKLLLANNADVNMPCLRLKCIDLINADPKLKAVYDAHMEEQRLAASARAVTGAQSSGFHGSRSSSAATPPVPITTRTHMSPRLGAQQGQG